MLNILKKVIDKILNERLDNKIKLEEQVFTIREGIIYPSKETIINVHDLIVESFNSEEEPIRITRGIRNESNLDYLLDHIKEWIGRNKSKNKSILEKSI